MHKEYVYLGISFWALGCASAMALSPAETSPPERRAFGEGELLFQVRGSITDVRQQVLDSLNSHRLAYKQELSDPYTYIITVYTPEPRDPVAVRRRRRASYMLRLSQVDNSIKCTAVALNWLVESKGEAEEVWSVQASDAEFRPSLREEFAKYLQSQPCQTVTG